MPEAVPKIGKLARYTEQAFDELVDALGAPPPVQPVPARKKAPPRKAAAKKTPAKTARKTTAKTASRTTQRGAKA